MMNFTKDMKVSAIKATVRETIFEILKNTFKEIYGEENVSTVNNNELSICCGTAEDENGCPMDVCSTIKPVVKNWYESKRTSKTTGEVTIIDAYDRLTEEESYYTAIQEAKNKKAREKAERAEKGEKTAE